MARASASSSFSYTSSTAGPKESRGGLSLARYGRESRAETVFGVFLPRVLLFVERQPEADAPGMWTGLMG
jgi:hypothetical protein